MLWNLILAGLQLAVVLASLIVGLIGIFVGILFVLWLIMLPFRKGDDE